MLKLSAGVIISPRFNNYPCEGPGPKFKKILEKSLTVPKMSHSAQSLPLYIAEHTQLVPKTEKLTQPIRIEHEKTFQLRQPIRIEYYVTLVVSQSESSITSPQSSRLRWRSLLGSRLESARYSLSQYMGTSPPPCPTSSAHKYTTRYPIVFSDFAFPHFLQPS